MVDITDTKGQHFVNRESTDKGKFAFTTDDYDVFEICFNSRVPSNMRGARHMMVKGRIGLTGETGETCPVCTVEWFSTLEIVALTLLGVLGLTDVGRCCRYMVKLKNKHNLKRENAKLQKKAELRKNILAEIKMERGNESVRASKDDGV